MPSLQVVGLLTFVLPALLLSACTVADYRQPVGDLAGAVDQSIATVDALDAKMTAARNEVWREAVIAGEAILIPPDTGCTLGAPGCSLTIRYREDGTVRTAPFPAQSLLPKPARALQHLKSYVENLTRIVDADTVGKVAESASATLGSLKNLEDTVNAARGVEAPSRIGRYEEPLLAAIEWAVGQYVERVKVGALRDATRDAQPVVDALRDLFNTAADAALAHETAKASRRFLDSQNAYEEKEDAGRLSNGDIQSYVRAAAAYDTALRASAARPLDAFAETHRTLKEQLNGEGDVSLADATAAIQDLVRRAKDFKAIVEDFQAVAPE